MVKIEMGDVEALAKKLSKVSNSYPNEVNKFMEKSVNGMKNSIASKRSSKIDYDELKKILKSF